MRVGYDAIRVFNNSTGLGNYSRYVVATMAAHCPQHKYVLFTPRRTMARDVGFTNAEIIEPGPGWWSSNVVARNVWRSIRLGRVIQQHSVDLYHGLTHELPLDIKSSDAASVVTMHDLIYLRFPEQFSRIDRMIYDRKFRRSCRDADAVVAISQQTKRDLIDFFAVPETKIHVVYQGCDPVFFEPPAASQLQACRDRWAIPEEFILHVGSIEARKNGVRLVQAYARSQCDAPLVLVGRRTRYQENVAAAIAACDLGDRVRILNDVSNEDLQALYRMALFSVYPSLFEGFGLPVLESLAAATPVLAATGSCLEEAGGDGAIYVDPYDIDALADGLTQLERDDALRRTLSEQGRRHAETFSQERFATQLNDVYQTVRR